MAEQYYGYIRLYRDVDVEKRVVEDDLKRLSEFIKHRANTLKDVGYYILTYIDRGDVDGWVIVVGRDKNKVEHEIELILGFIESSLSSISGKKVNKPRTDKLIPIPRTRNF